MPSYLEDPPKLNLFDRSMEVTLQTLNIKIEEDAVN